MKKNSNTPTKEPNYRIFKMLFFGSIIIFALWKTYFKKDETVEQVYSYNPQDTNLNNLTNPITALPDSSTVYFVAQALIMRNHATRTAPIFRAKPTVFVNNPIDSSYKILSYMKSRNSNFNMIKEDFTIRLHFKGGDADVLENWNILSISFANDRL